MNRFDNVAFNAYRNKTVEILVDRNGATDAQARNALDTDMSRWAYDMGLKPRALAFVAVAADFNVSETTRRLIDISHAMTA